MGLGFFPHFGKKEVGKELLKNEKNPINKIHVLFHLGCNKNKQKKKHSM